MSVYVSEAGNDIAHLGYTRSADPTVPIEVSAQLGISIYPSTTLNDSQLTVGAMAEQVKYVVLDARTPAERCC